MEDKRKIKRDRKIISSQINKEFANEPSDPTKIIPNLNIEDFNTQNENISFWKNYSIIVKTLIYLLITSPVWVILIIFLNWLLGIYFIAFLAMTLSFLAVWYFPKNQREHLRNKSGSKTQSEFDRERDILKVIDDTRKTVAQIIGGVFFVFGLIVTYYNYDLTRERLSVERYTEAIKLLRDTDQFERTAGLYEIQNIAGQATSLKPAIKDILILYINNHSQNLLQLDKTSDYKCVDYSKENNKDIEIAAQIIGGKYSNYSDTGNVTKFEDVFLYGANLSDSNFENTRFINGCLNGTYFTRAILTNTEFIKTDITNVDFSFTDLRAADLTSTNITADQIKQAYVDNFTKVPGDLEYVKEIRIKELTYSSLTAYKKKRY